MPSQSIPPQHQAGSPTYVTALSANGDRKWGQTPLSPRSPPAPGNRVRHDLLHPRPHRCPSSRSTAPRQQAGSPASVAALQGNGVSHHFLQICALNARLAPAHAQPGGAQRAGATNGQPSLCRCPPWKWGQTLEMGTDTIPIQSLGKKMGSDTISFTAASSTHPRPPPTPVQPEHRAATTNRQPRLRRCPQCTTPQPRPRPVHFGSSRRSTSTSTLPTISNDRGLSLSIVSCGVCHHELPGPYSKSIRFAARAPSLRKGT